MQKTDDYAVDALLGYARATKKANAAVQAENDRLKAMNTALPEAQRKPDDQLGLKDLWTEETYRQAMVNALGVNYLANDDKAAAQDALAKIATLTPQQQGQVFQALGLGAVAQADPAAAAELALGRFLAASRDVRIQLIKLVYPEYT